LTWGKSAERVLPTKNRLAIADAVSDAVRDVVTAAAEVSGITEYGIDDQLLSVIVGAEFESNVAIGFQQIAAFDCVFRGVLILIDDGFVEADGTAVSVATRSPSWLTLRGIFLLPSGPPRNASPIALGSARAYDEVIFHCF